MRPLTWSSKEKAIVRRAFDRALARELKTAIRESKDMEPRPYPCFGSNENCSRCGGLGSYVLVPAPPQEIGGADASFYGVHTGVQLEKNKYKPVVFSVAESYLRVINSRGQFTADHSHSIVPGGLDVMS